MSSQTSGVESQKPKSLPGLPPEPPFYERLAQRGTNFLVHLAQIGRMTRETFAAMFQRPFELQSTMHQMEQLGIRSLGIACATALFTGMVMAVQFAFGLQKFGGMEYTGRVIGLSFSRELAPTLTAVIVGGRIGSGIAAEVGSMAVTEQIDAIRALGADPMKKLVVPRLVSCVIIMPVLGALALVIGFSGAMIICDWQFGIPWGFFLRSALGSMNFRDFWMGLMKCPFFGAIIALVGCHFGMITRGGTEGVGQSTTRAVVGVSISILVADFVLTKLGFIIFG
ncbi:ABC transporter permease [Polyangium sp. 6x1]|uniref:MlaE family ABC transporter permease n=1 Tax=Polyangium sp. 6x1 TaxID=3042689 RepID=UPI00248212FA|nr:ABC transporter permease [Polyangium sp. 6x1]MDI1444942.1 ABC transporter permease [Polyangium sp. 6x1]